MSVLIKSCHRDEEMEAKAISDLRNLLCNMQQDRKLTDSVLCMRKKQPILLQLTQWHTTVSQQIATNLNTPWDKPDNLSAARNYLC